jgi:hypothetical protein
MRVVLNASSVMGAVMFSIANIWGMNLWSGQNRLQNWPWWSFVLVRACAARPCRSHALPPGSRRVRQRACLAAYNICAAGRQHAQASSYKRYMQWMCALETCLPGADAAWLCAGSSAEPGSPEAICNERLRCGGMQGATTIALLPVTALAAFCVYLHSRGLGPTNISR